jgi:flavin-binding protein dodecin
MYTAGRREYVEGQRISRWRRHAMSNHTYRVAEIVGSSPGSIDEAVRNGLGRASKTLRNLDWFEVEAIRGRLEDGQIGHIQVTMKVGFRLEDPDATE